MSSRTEACNLDLSFEDLCHLAEQHAEHVADLEAMGMYTFLHVPHDPDFDWRKLDDDE